MPVITISKLLSRKFNFTKKELTTNSSYLLDIIQEIDAEHPGFSKCVLEENGIISGFVCVFVNNNMLDRNISNVKLMKDDKVFFINRIAGG